MGTARARLARRCAARDLILVMEKRHVHTLCEIAPEMRGKVMLFGHWDHERDIPDPYRKSRDAFEAVYALLDQSARLWLPLPTVISSMAVDHLLANRVALAPLLAAQIAAGALSFALMVIGSRHPLVVEIKQSLCRSEKMKVLLRAY